VANILSNSLSAFAIDAAGALTPVAGSPFTGFFSPSSVAVDPSGKFAYVANRDAANISAFTIGASGALTAIPGSPFPTGQGPFSVIVDSSGKFAYVANQISNSVSAFKLDATTGALAPLETVPSGRGPVSAALTR
jgi:6-phosphogluconolactonase (cycloisomerase 2 family)